MNTSSTTSDNMFSKLLEGFNEMQNSMKKILQTNKGKNEQPRFGGTSRKKSFQCFHCKEEGHMKKDCPSLNNAYRDNSQTRDQSLNNPYLDNSQARSQSFNNPYHDNSLTQRNTGNESNQDTLNYKGLDRPHSSFKICSISKSCWLADVRINDTSFDMLVDTGSDVTLVSSEIFNKLGFNKMFLNEVSAKLNTADGDPLEVIRMTTISLFIGEQLIAHTVIVAGLGELDGILGIDFLSKNNVSIDTANGTLKSPNFDVCLHKDKSLSSTCARVHLTETVHIPPNSKFLHMVK
ncbi:unnamed protein product [Mytilus coruscus]|uniref:CCHC-type domain-containing protein n=1 Tax=Mytilus coruscus TaxID=42192 RepID=A0A6J8BCA0_MYTCO|nr:unnamed protein product [Mytilus coruscus]